MEHFSSNRKTFAATTMTIFQQDNATLVTSQEACECGIHNRLDSRIVGGERSNINKYPWMVGISHFGLIICGGALISRNHIISAAHCFKTFDLSNGPPLGIGVKVGITRQDEVSQHIDIAEITVHEMYQKKVPGHYDIVLIKIKEPLTINSNIRPICLPDSHDHFEDQDGIVTGWGVLSHDGPLSQELREVSLKVLDLKVCQEMLDRYHKKVDENNVCAGGEQGKDACQGDSGSPLVVATNGVFKVIGLVSWGLQCALDKVPGVYTNVMHYVEWIKEKVGQSDCF